MKQYAGFLVLVWDSIGFAFRRFFFILADVRRHKDCCLVWNVNKRSAVIYTTNTLSRDNIVVKSQHCTTKTKCYSNVDATALKLQRCSNVSSTLSIEFNLWCSMLHCQQCCNVETTTSNSQQFHNVNTMPYLQIHYVRQMLPQNCD